MKNFNESLIDQATEAVAQKEIVGKYPELNHITDLLIEQGMVNERISELTIERNKVDKIIDPQRKIELGAQISSLDNRLIEIEGKIKTEYLKIRLELNRDLPPLDDIIIKFRDEANKKKIEIPDKKIIILN